MSGFNVGGGSSQRIHPGLTSARREELLTNRAWEMYNPGQPPPYPAETKDESIYFTGGTHSSSLFSPPSHSPPQSPSSHLESKQSAVARESHQGTVATETNPVEMLQNLKQSVHKIMDGVNSIHAHGAAVVSDMNSAENSLAELFASLDLDHKGDTSEARQTASMQSFLATDDLENQLKMIKSQFSAAHTKANADLNKIKGIVENCQVQVVSSLADAQKALETLDAQKIALTSELDEASVTLNEVLYQKISFNLTQIKPQFEVMQTQLKELQSIDGTCRELFTQITTNLSELEKLKL